MFLSISCKKEGTGGKATITGIARHHSTPIANAVIYIKYGATEFPGPDPSSYDLSVTADANGKYEFSGMNKGDYYLYGIGYDPAPAAIVSGGTSVSIKWADRKKTTTVDIAITE